MLITVVDQCLTLAFDSATRHVASRRQRTMGRARPWNAPLAAYPLLAAAMEKAASEGLLAPQRARRRFN